MKRRKKKEKTSNFMEDSSEFGIYRKGAFLGALCGGVAAGILGKKIILWIAIGAIAGGYINYQIHKDDSITGLKLGKLRKFKQNNSNDTNTNEDANN